MAAVATIGTTVRFQLKDTKSTISSPFLGRKLEIKYPFQAMQQRMISNLKVSVVCAGNELVIDFVNNLFLGVGVGLPCTVMACGDVIYRSTLPRSNELTITAPGVILALGALSYLWATPGVAPGFWDMFVLAFVERLFRPTFKKDDFMLGKKLGEGAFGVVYRVSLADKLKEGDLVLKKATEYCAVEIWMNERVRRACASSCADFLRVHQRKEVNIGLYGDSKGRRRCKISC
ncbi:hypothetical protein MKX01_038169 [Papaver californicum]|nr:hypothetical protein MKX01_038169 [Papaver californicum]